MNEDSSPELRTPRECGTVDCAGVPTCSFTWPGGKPAFGTSRADARDCAFRAGQLQLACTDCANRAVNIAAAMGFVLSIAQLDAPNDVPLPRSEFARWIDAGPCILCDGEHEPNVDHHLADCVAELVKNRDQQRATILSLGQRLEDLEKAVGLRSVKKETP